MPPFTTSPFANVPMAMPGRPIFVFGRHVDTTAPTRFAVRQVFAFADDATITGTITEGLIPDTHHRISTSGFKDPKLNVTDAKIQAVNIDKKSGSGTITYELPSPVFLAIENHAALAIIPKLPAEEIVEDDFASMAVCLPDSPEGHSVQGFSAEITWPHDAIAGDIEVQIADILRESAFHTVDKIIFPKSRYDTPAGISANFARLFVKTISGDGRVTGRILVK